MRGAARYFLLLAAGCRGSLGQVEDQATTESLMEEIARLRAEVASLKANEPARERDLSAVGGTLGTAAGGQAKLAQSGPPQGGAAAAGAGSALPWQLGSAPGRLGPGDNIAGDGSLGDRCESEPLFVRLHSALQKLSLLEQDPVEVSFQIYDTWERDPSFFEVCPVGLVTALVYLSIAQEQDWKYRLLHRATYLLYSTPGLAVKMMSSRWPMSDRLIRTMYNNSEVVGRAHLDFGSVEAQPRGPAPAFGQEVREADELSVKHSGSVVTRFSSVLFYYFYHQADSPCACRTRSWCLPHWLRYLTNNSVDVWLAGRDEQRSLFRMDHRGCLRSLGIGLDTHHFASTFDVVFVFEINSLMHPQCRVLPARKVLLYPTFDLTSGQLDNFEALGVTALPDDQVMKPPNPWMRQLLEQAAADRRSRGQPRSRLFVMPADIRPMKGQTDFLQALLFEGAQRPSAVRRLKGLTVVIAGGCDGNQTYCSEVLDFAKRVNAEGLLSIMVADILSDEELAQIYASALGVVLHSRVDCNPRAVYEGLVADTPFFVSVEARMHSSVLHLGHMGDRDPSRLPEALADFAEFCEAGGFEGRAGEFSRLRLTELESYRAIVEWMDRSFVEGTQVEPTIKSEDAFSGAFAGLGMFLGGLGAAPGSLGAAAASGLKAEPEVAMPRFTEPEPIRR